MDINELSFTIKVVKEILTMNLDSVFVLKSEEKGYVSSVSGEEGHEKVTFSDFWMDAKPFMDFDSDKDDSWYPVQLANRLGLKIVKITATEDDFE